jgi:hypothetical protein
LARRGGTDVCCHRSRRSRRCPRYQAGGRAFARIAQFHTELTALRRDLHAHPELGFEEVYTSARVAQALRLCGVDEVHTGIGKTGVVGLVHGRHGPGHMAADGRPMPWACAPTWTHCP